MHLDPCVEAPTLSATPLAAVECLGGTLHTFSASLLTGQRVDGPVPPALPDPAQALCRLAATPVAVA
eukprot:10226244-Lingulodinium_polyedra.AAC.1